MPDKEAERLEQVHRFIAGQPCREQPGEPYSTDADSASECREPRGHDLLRWPHRAADGTTW